MNKPFSEYTDHDWELAEIAYCIHRFEQIPGVLNCEYWHEVLHVIHHDIDCIAFLRGTETVLRMANILRIGVVFEKADDVAKDIQRLFDEARDRGLTNW